jgi:mannitol/fructose-specific phosphotransferase system IIA component (Ntr-type)
LQNVGAIWSSHVDAMKEMIQLFGLYMVVAPEAAPLHTAPEMGAKRLAMRLVIPRVPVPFGHPEHDPVRLAPALSSVDHEAHVDALKEAMRLVTDADSVEPWRLFREGLANHTEGQGHKKEGESG